ncbi:MAG: calcium/sodium antiporter [Oscillospiraceae bacterium]|nr:calcium/sodium antiporter [Oscillospiraceae bacterium]
MRTVLEIFLLLSGFVLLIKGADVFVDASVHIAKRLKIPAVVIGLTVVAMGTSLPEAVVSVSAALGGSNALAVGNVAGSNIFNLLLVVGLCALIKPVAVRFRDIVRDYWVSVGAAVLLLLMMVIFTDAIPRYGSLLLFAVFTGYMVSLIRKALKNKGAGENKREDGAPPAPLAKSAGLAVLGAALIIAGGQMTVSGAVSLALKLGITERVVGLTIVAIGTSLPELVTSLVATRKGEEGIAVGNIVGSNIFNILFVLGLSGMIMPLPVDAALIFDMAILTAGSLVFVCFAYTGRRIVRLEGVSMLAMYAAYMGFIVLG